MRKYLTVMLLVLFYIYLPVFAGEKWGRDGAWGRPDPRWGRGLDEWTLEDLPYIVDWWRIEEGVEADSNNTIADSGDVVFFWRGSINGMALAQGINSRRPEYRTDQINGQPALVFDGIDDWLQVAFGAEYAQPNTIIFVCTEPDGATSDEVLFTGKVDGKRNELWWHITSYRIYAGIYRQTAHPLGTGFKIFAVVYNTDNSIFRVNGVDVPIAATVGTQALNGLVIGSYFTGAFSADISVTDIVVINALIGTGDLQRVERWLNKHRRGIY